MVPAFGPGMTLALLLLTPLFWSLPVALAMSELAAALPDEGGYVTWTRRAFGPFWAFQVGWWSWIDSFVDVAVYPALFVEYARFWYPAVTPGERWLLVVGFIVGLSALNVVGVRPTGRAAVVLAVAALLPIAALALVGLGTARVSPWTPLVPEGQGIEALGLGLAVVMWNYSGWDTPATVLGETRAPERTFRLAALVALPVLTASYVAPVGVALASGAIEWHAWTTGALPVIARRIGGDWLGHAVAAGAVVGTAGLFMSLLLTNSRLPYVLARDRAMPAWLGVVHRRFGTPWAAVVASAALYAIFAVFSFKELIVLNVWLYSLSLLVELAASSGSASTSQTCPGRGACRAASGGRWPPSCSRRSSRSPPSRPRAGSTRWRGGPRPPPGPGPGARSGPGASRGSGGGRPGGAPPRVRHARGAGGWGPLAEGRGRCEATAAVLAKGPGFGLYALMDFVVDQFFPFVDALEARLEALEAAIFHERFSAETTERIYRLKRDLLEVKRAVSPLVDVCTRLMRPDVLLIPADPRAYFRAVYHHAIRLTEMVDMLT